MATIGESGQPVGRAQSLHLAPRPQSGRLFRPRRSAHTQWPVRGLALMVVWLLAAVGTSAQSSSPTEYEVKAAFLYNFGKFVEWPADDSAGADDTFDICVLGRDPFGDVLDETVEGKSLRGRKLVVRRIGQTAEGLNCHILFISSSEERNLGYILSVLQGRSVLTVGEMRRFAQRGGMINFRIEENRIRFEINLGAAESAGLTVSSQLLKLARIIGKKGGSGD